MALKFNGSISLASSGCLAVTFLMLLFSNSCTSQQAVDRSGPPKVQGGSPATRGRFPYMCSIRKRGSELHICAGTLIDVKWIMTAAHCLDPDNRNSAGMSPIVYCNIYKRDEQDVSKRFTTRKCYLHHLWDGNVLNGNDIALCQLENSVSVAIPDLSSSEDNFAKGDAFSLLGWGRPSSTSNPTEALQLGFPLPYFDSSACNRTAIWAGRIKSSMICAGLGSPDKCKSESGAPLIIRHDPVSAHLPEDPQLDLIVGITSFGLPDCEADASDVYTRISGYRPWIDSIMQRTEQDCSVHNSCEEKSSPNSAVPETRSLYFDAVNRTDNVNHSNDDN